ncbi:hypothetical protein AVEN_82157-1, partial [Araneus ventricosus]
MQLKVQFLAGVFLKLINIIFHLQSLDLGQRHNPINCRLHRNCLKPLNVTFDNAHQPELLPSRRQFDWTIRPLIDTSVERKIHVDESHFMGHTSVTEGNISYVKKNNVT